MLELEFLDAGPDGFGRRRFFLYWRDDHTGLRRGQIFNAVPAVIIGDRPAKDITPR